MKNLTTAIVLEWLTAVKDPEIPVLSLVDLGVISDVQINAGAVKIIITPTFVGCPALEVMQLEIRNALSGKGVESVEIHVSYEKPWTSDMISPRGRDALKKFGLAPPPLRQIFSDLEVLHHAECPQCGNTNTELKNIFGPTLCRAIHYCHDCREAFEQFKPV